MSITDRAFIKAFGMEPFDAPVAVRAAVGRRRSDLSSSLRLLRSAPANLDEQYDAGAWYRPDAEVPEEHSNDAAAPSAILRIDSAEQHDTAAPHAAAVSRVASGADAAMAPHGLLSGHTPQQTSRESTRPAPSQPGTPFRAAWEVDELHWPAICLRLARTTENDIARAGERLLSAARRGRKVVVVTGLLRGEGRTTLTLCLARWAGSAGARTALVDADVDNPRLADQLGLDAPHGWADMAAKRIPLAEAAISLHKSGLTVVPCLPTHASSQVGERAHAGASGMLDSAPWAAHGGNLLSTLPPLLAELSSAFDLVLVDGGPLAPSMLARDSASACDVALVVHDMRRTSQGQFDEALAQLQMRGVHALAIAQNFTPIAPHASAPRSTIPS